MIFVHRHEHRWVLTAAVIHGCRVRVCIVCGDRGYDATESAESDL